MKRLNGATVQAGTEDSAEGAFHHDGTLQPVTSTAEKVLISLHEQIQGAL